MPQFVTYVTRSPQVVRLPSAPFERGFPGSVLDEGPHPGLLIVGLEQSGELTSLHFEAAVEVPVDTPVMGTVDGHLGRAKGQRRPADELRSPLHRLRIDLGSRMNGVNQSDGQRLGGLDEPARVDEVLRLGRTDQSGESLRTAGAGDDAQQDLRLAEFGVLGRKPDVGGERDLESATECEACDRSDGGLSDRRQRLGEVLQQMGVLIHDLEGHVGHLLDVGTGGEHPVAAVEDHCRDVRTCVRLLRGLEQLTLHLRIQGIHLRAIKTYRPDASVDLQARELSHAARLPTVHATPLCTSHYVDRVTGAWSPWRTVLAFGYVSLAADMVYEGMRSASGPLLLSLGASALVVGLVTGAGEAIALGLRLVSGPLADRTGRHWQLTVQGYVLTAVSVPLLAITPFLGAAGLVVASALIILERTGKAIRSPSKSTLLARMSKPVGRGRGFAVHKALDQVGAFAGPLLVAGLAAATGHLWAGFAILAIPGAVTIVLLGLLRQGTNLDDPIPVEEQEPAAPGSLPRSFWAFSLSCACSTVGLMTFGVMSVHLVRAELVAAAWVPIVYAGAMAVQAFAALASGFAYDSIGPRILYALPLLVAAVPALVFAAGLGIVLLGVAVWALATAVQDSTVKALVADLVPGERLATAYGVFATAQGLGALAGGGLAGGLYEHHLGLLITIIAGLQAAALITLVITVQGARRSARNL